MEEKEINSIKESYPSICYSCDRARRVVSEDFEKKGYVGCCLFVQKQREDSGINPEVCCMNIEAEQMYSGWVYLKQVPFTRNAPTGAGIWTNNQLMTVKTRKCAYYVENSD